MFQQLPERPLDLELRAHRLLVLRDLLSCLDQAAPTEDGAPGRALHLELDDPLVQAYVLGLCDMLELFGALRWQDAELHLVSPLAGYLMRELRALSIAGAGLVRDWDATGVRGNASAALDTSANLLAALERQRLDRDPNALPLRETTAALGVISRGEDGTRELLLVWDLPANAWQLPGGRSLHSDETLAATLLRELAEELECAALVEGRDLELAALGEPLECTRLSPSYGLLTRTHFQLFAVRWLTDLPDLPHNVQWLSERELLAGCSDEGLPIAAEPFLQLLGAPARHSDLALGAARMAELENIA